MRGAAALVIHVRLLGRLYQVEPWRCASPGLGESVAYGWDDFCGVVMEGRIGKHRTFIATVYFEEE